MNTNMLAVASSLSDLLDRIAALAGKEREASAELVAHLAALDERPSLYAAHGFGSLFNYCTEALCLSEDAACNRIIAARACRRFPVILDLLASGEMTLTYGQRFLEEAAEDPEVARNAPYTTPVRRLDEGAAARKPVVRQPRPA